MDLHYSQTEQFVLLCADRFHYLMDLHYSQTGAKLYIEEDEFHYLMDLHYSQTIGGWAVIKCSFTTLWIYTILKQSLGG